MPLRVPFKTHLQIQLGIVLPAPSPFATLRRYSISNALLNHSLISRFTKSNILPICPPYLSQQSLSVIASSCFVAMGSSALDNQSESQKKVLAVIFDLDGTLLNTEKASRGVLSEFLAKYGKNLITDSENRRVGKTQKESAIAFVRNYDLPLTPDQFIEEIMPLYRTTWAEAESLPGASDLLMHLHGHQVPLALASNSSSEYIDAKISYHKGWKDCFTVILGSDEVKSGKPSPDLFLEAAKRMGVDAAQCLVIEDSLVGVKAAKAAGMKVVVVPSESEADSAALADSVLGSLLEFQPELWGLPSLDDCMHLSKF